jgi:hypothetical protein
MLKKGMYLIVLLLMQSACQKEMADFALLQNTWIIQSIKFQQTGDSLFPTDRITLTFDKNMGYQLQLSINSCGGSYAVEGSKMIKIEAPACTYICCDDTFSEHVG